jgi:Na+/H+ antiporter NhaD/arsenite permease-like protein
MGWTIAVTATFVVTYVLISIRRIPWVNLDRPTVALLGAVGMVLLGAVPFGLAVRKISWETIALLLGMMTIVAYLQLARFFEFVSTWILLRAGTPRRLLALLIATSGLLSALFVNDTICVLFTPIVLGAVVRAKLNPVPFLIALATSANIGSVMTLTGNPQNMLVGLYSGIPYGRFLLLLLPAGSVGLLLDWAILRWLYRKDLEGSFDLSGLALPRIDKVVVFRILGVLALMTAGFLLPLQSWVPHLESGQKLPVVALAAALLVVLVGRYPAAQAFRHVDWGLLVFFSGLFVVVAGIGATPILDACHERMAPWIASGAGLTSFTVVASNVVSNVPFILVAQPWIRGEHAWTLVAMASTFAGNLTVVGSVANMIVLELSRDRVAIGFWQYLRAGLPVTVVTTVAGFLSLWALHLAGRV